MAVWLARALTVAYFVAALGILGVRYLILPQADDYRSEIAAALGAELGLPVEIGQIDTSWSGLRPRLKLAEVVIRDDAGRPALVLSRVDATISWSSLPRWEPHFRTLEFFGPELEVRRDAVGRILVAGLPIDTAGSERGGFADWLLAQDEIAIHGAGLIWTDEVRGAAPLVLDQVEIRVLNRGDSHRFALKARPPGELAGMVELRGDLSGSDPAALAGWSGRLFARLEGAELGGWRQWVDYPVAVDGRGGLNAWLSFSGTRLAEALADVSLRSVKLRLADDLPLLDLARLDGRIGGDFRTAGFALSTRALALTFADGELALPPTDLALRIATSADGRPDGGHFSVNQLDVAALAQLAGHLPLDPAVRTRIATLAPDGRISEVSLDWKGAADAPRSWKLAARFEGIGFAADGGWPGTAGLSGDIDGTDQGGRFSLAGSGASIDLPDIFAQPRLSFESLQAGGGWGRRDGKLEVRLDKAEFANSDAAGNASGRYLPRDMGPGEIDLQARLTRADGTAVWRYMPLVVNQQTRTWLRDSIVAGKSVDSRLRLRGDLADFPFRDGKDGQFLVTVRISDARLDYAPGWPSIEGIDGELRFEGPGMYITAERGRIGMVKLGRVTADLPDLDADEILTIRGTAAGPSNGFLDFVNGSPVGERIDRFTETMSAAGAGSLDLLLVMPLQHIEDTQVTGEYRFAANTVRIAPDLPPLTEASARVGFTAQSLRISDGAARLLGEPLKLSGESRPDGSVAISAAGTLAAAGLARSVHSPLFSHLAGRTGWQTDVSVRGRSTEVAFRTDLQGISSSLPAPFNKSAADKLPLRLALSPAEQGTVQSLSVSLGDKLKGEVLRRRSADGWQVERGGLALNMPLKQAIGGIQVAATLPLVDADAWLRALDSGNGESAAPGDAAAAPAWQLAGVNLLADEVRLAGERWRNVDLRAAADAEGWKGVVRSDAVEGNFDWRTRDEGTLQARLARLAVDPADKPAGSTAAPAVSESVTKSLPTLDVIAERFMLRGKNLGRLELQARNRDGLWLLDNVTLASAAGSLRGDGRWRPGRRSEFSAKVETTDVGRYLAQIGYPDAVRRGKATLSGQFDWAGPPTRIDYPSLSGRFDIEAEDGQFNKLEPGVGRLLGVLSLQSLPRRITLDFRDVFSDGFAFDRIGGSVRLDGGAMRTSDLEIRGPAAKVFMTGSVDLSAETQNLRVKVQPTLSESVAVGAALANSAAGVINPVAGVVTYLAQKMLKDPIERFFSFDYGITGKWDDPQVKRLTGADAAPAGSAGKAERDGSR